MTNATPATNLRHQNKAQTRQSIIDAALAIFSRQISFQAISLREVMREAGLVPAAFYRHFADMEELGVVLASEQAQILNELKQRLISGFSQPAKSQTQQSIHIFFNLVQENPVPWAFIARERWGGCAPVQIALHQSIQAFMDTLVDEVADLKAFTHLSPVDRRITVEVLIGMATTWAMEWIGLSHQYQGDEFQKQLQYLEEKALRQIRLLLKGSLNWKPATP